MLAGLGAGNGVAVSTAGFLGEPLDKGRGVGDFALGFRQRLALFLRQERGELRQERDEPVEDQDLRRPRRAPANCPGSGETRLVSLS